MALAVARSNTLLMWGPRYKLAYIRWIETENRAGLLLLPTMEMLATQLDPQGETEVEHGEEK
eukprot:14258611-Ditylum_brightwellii.AAC.1